MTWEDGKEICGNSREQATSYTYMAWTVQKKLGDLHDTVVHNWPFPKASNFNRDMAVYCRETATDAEHILREFIEDGLFD